MVGEEKEVFLVSCREIAENLCDCSAIEKRIARALDEYNDLTAKMQAFIYENAEHGMNQELYDQKIKEYEEKTNTALGELNRLREKRANSFHAKNCWLE